MARVEDRRVTDRILVVRSEGRRKFVRAMRRLEDNIQTDLQEIG
jgi:hypothetical protein